MILVCASKDAIKTCEFCVTDIWSCSTQSCKWTRCRVCRTLLWHCVWTLWNDSSVSLQRRNQDVWILFDWILKLFNKELWKGNMSSRVSNSPMTLCLNLWNDSSVCFQRRN